MKRAKAAFKRSQAPLRPGSALPMAAKEAPAPAPFLRKTCVWARVCFRWLDLCMGKDGTRQPGLGTVARGLPCLVVVWDEELTEQFIISSETGYA